MKGPHTYFVIILAEVSIPRFDNTLWLWVVAFDGIIDRDSIFETPRLNNTTGLTSFGTAPTPELLVRSSIDCLQCSIPPLSVRKILSCIVPYAIFVLQSVS